ncbi:hypothetical protein BH09MYX1_BH09MYX1_34440 [soil metagenome]
MLATLAPPEDSIVRRTWLALLVPRRLLPILAVCLPLVYAERSYSRHPDAVYIGIGLCLTFVLVAPLSYRVLFPEGLDLGHGAIRLILYAIIGAGAVLTAGLYIPRSFGIDHTFLTARSSLAIDIALFLVGGWGLGRDIGLEDSLMRERRRAEGLSRAAEQAQLLALKAHLDPHFLFNTLNAIAEWCREDGATAERAVLELSGLLRDVLSGVTEESWALARELELCKTLLSLHTLRDPNMFSLAWDVDEDACSIQVPPMILFPLVENAIKHGPAKGHRGEVSIHVVAEGSRVHITIANPGRFTGKRKGSHGLPTAEKRLALAYDGDASLEARADGERTVVSIDLPKKGPRLAA